MAGQTKLRIILIGGGGFIGSHLASALARGGHHVTIIDALMVNNLYARTAFSAMHEKILRARYVGLHRHDFVMADARDYHLLSAICKSRSPDVIVHLAAVAHQDRAQKSPHTTFDHSLRTLENALDIAVALKAKRFVYFSSSTVYGDWPESGIATETDICKPKGIYGALKLAGEGMVRAYTDGKGLEHVIVRPSALYGPGCVSGRVIQKFIESAIKGQWPLAVTQASLDFTHIGDLVSGAVLAVEHQAAAGQTYNLTFGEGRTVEQAARAIEPYFGDFQMKYATQESNFARRGTLSIAKARDELGYDPQIDLEKGVADYVKWYKDSGYYK